MLVQCCGPKISVLYLDDEPVCLELFGETFGGECDVRTASTREEALRALAEARFDVVISDQRMPGATGTDFLREVGRAAPGSLRVLLSGAVAVGQVLPALSSGAVEFFVPKPWSVQHLRQVFERIASRS
jgi:two-component system, sensor histidine kinase and response regulator